MHMSTFKFKTNINCNGCLAKVSPTLNGASDIEKWEVDLANPQKTLTIQTDSLRESEIVALVNSAGYQAVTLND